MEAGLMALTLKFLENLPHKKFAGKIIIKSVVLKAPGPDISGKISR